MTKEDEEPRREGEWSRLLNRWTSPPRRRELDERVMEAYRRRVARARPGWQGFFATSVRVPLPVALVVVLIAVVSTVVALRKAPTLPASPATTEPARLRPAAVASSLDLRGFEMPEEVKVTILEPEGRR